MALAWPRVHANRHGMSQSPSDYLILDTILLAVKAWTMVALDDSVPGEPTYRWKEHESLHDTLTRYLPLPHPLYQNKLELGDRHVPSQQQQEQLLQQQQTEPLQQQGQPEQQKDQLQQQHSQPQQQQQQTHQPNEQQQLANSSGGTASIDLLATSIQQQDYKDADRNREFEGFFTFCDMTRLSSIKIRWTNNFLSHLRVRKLREPGFTTTIFVFHHATVLPAIAAA